MDYPVCKSVKVHSARRADYVHSGALDFDARECLVCSVQPVMESRHTDWVSLCLILLFLLHLSSSFSLFFSFFNLLLILFLHLLFLSSLHNSHFILSSSCPPSLPLQSTFTLFPTHFSLPSLISSSSSLSFSSFSYSSSLPPLLSQLLIFSNFFSPPPPHLFSLG